MYFLFIWLFGFGLSLKFPKVKNKKTDEDWSLTLNSPFFKWMQRHQQKGRTQGDEGRADGED